MQVIIKTLTASLSLILQPFGVYCEGEFKWGCGYVFLLCWIDNSAFHYFLSPEGKEPSISHRLNICSVEIFYFFEGWLIKAMVGTHTNV